MKILLANHTPVYGSGSGTYAAMLANELQSMGHQVAVLTPLAEQFVFNHRIRNYSAELDSDLGNKFPSFTGHALSAVRYRDLDAAQLKKLGALWSRSLDDIYQTWAPDVIHVQHLWVIARAVVSFGIMPVVTCHGSELIYSEQIEAKDCLFPEIGKIHTILTISDFVTQKLKKRFGDLSNVISLYNPYDNKRFFFKKDSFKMAQVPHLGFVGRLVLYKNCALFLNLVKRLSEKRENIKASIIGDGPERHSLEDLSRELNISNIVNFYGQLPQEELRELYQEFTIVVVPGINEPFGMVAIEAAACGTPVVVDRSGGLQELIYPPYIQGYESNNLAALVELTNTVISQPATMQFRLNANMYIKRNYSLSEYVKVLDTTYRKVAAKITNT